MSAPAQIFKAYDIRGLYGDEIDGDVAEQVGRAFVRVLASMHGKDASDLRVGLGRDMRLQAPEMAGRYRDGMVSEGAVALSGDGGIGEIRDLIDAGLGEIGSHPRGGSSEDVDVYADFHEAALKFIDTDVIKPLKVVVDGGNGMAGPMVGPLLEKLGLDLVTTYWTPDGSFPDHEPNPLLEENRRFIIDKVREEGADLGIAWDGDADRCFFIDDTGTFVDGDFLTALLAESILEKRPGADILYDVRASRAVPDLVERLGGTAHMNRVGHAFFKVRMRDEGGVFGGEVSGHYYFADFYNADSGTVPALLILELLSKKEKTLS